MGNRTTSIALATVAVGIALAASGCSAAAPETKPTPSATESAEAALPTVSLNTTCGLLFGSDLDGPTADATDIVTRFVEAPDLSTVTADEMETTIDALDGAAQNAEADLVPYIDAQIAALEQLLDAKNGGGNSSVSFTDFKAASLELLNRCERFL